MSFNNISESVGYDSLDRVGSKEVKCNNSTVFTKHYAYRDSTYATDQPASVTYSFGKVPGSYTVTYEYINGTGQLGKINFNGRQIKYAYANNALRREDNQLLGKSSVKFCGDDGNINTDITGSYQPDTNGIISGTYTYYSYDGDMLSSYGDKTCMYDKMGNPTAYLGKTATWKGRQMLSFDGNTFAYDGRGRRIGKNGLTFIYDSQGNLIKQSNGLEFFYDFEGIAACKYNNQLYLYITDGQGNVIALIDSNGNEVVQYWYDAWGNHKVVDNNGNEITAPNHIGNLNPFRYRGYFYRLKFMTKREIKK